jgi:hypothetical protein
MRWGERRGALEYVVKISSASAIRYAAAQTILLLASIVVGAQVLQWITHSFQVRTSYAQCFTLLAYGFSPIVLSRLLDAVPALPTWLCWTAGALLSYSMLYHGVALMLRPEQTKGFGLYLVSVILVILSSGLSHFIALAVLHGKIFA